MSDTDGTPATLTDAVDAARAEIVARGEPDPFTNETVEPPASGQEDGIEAAAGEDQASGEAEEQSQEVLDDQDDEAAEDSSEELFADLADEAEAEEETPASEEEEETPAPTSETFEVPGEDEPVPVQELINGYLRQGDYTRKTQEVARDRERLSKAEEFYTALTEHPKELAQQLAAAAGYIEPGAQPLKVVDLPFRSDEDIQTEVDKRVSEVLGDIGNPEEAKQLVEEARNVLATRQVDDSFAAIEAKIGKPIGPKSRKLILEEAVKRETSDLELVFDALMQRQQEKARNTDQRKRSAPVKPTGKPSQSTVTEDPETALDAVALAAQEAGVDIDLSALNFS